MGLFSSEYKYHAFAGSSTLMPAEDRESTVMQLLLQAVIDGSATLAQAVSVGLQTDLYRRAIKMARYAAKEDGYPYGFPTVPNTLYSVTTDMLRPFIEAEAGEPIDFRSYYIRKWDAPATQVYFIEKEINEKYMDPAYFPWSIGDPEDTNWSPTDTEVEIPVVIDNPDPTPDSYELSSNQYDVVKTETNFQVSFPYGEGLSWDVAQPFDMSGYAVEGDWIQVKYRVKSDLEQYKYWAYLIGSNAIPELESLITKTIFYSEYLPIAVLLHDTVWFDEQVPEDLVLEKGLDKLLKILGTDPWDVKEDFINSIENPPEDTPQDQIPNIDDFWDFFLHFSMPMRTRDNSAREYLFHYYRHLKSQTWTTFADYQAWCSDVAGSTLGAVDQPYSQFSVEEGEEYTGYIARYAWSYIEEATFDGQYTPPGWDRPLKTREYYSDEYDRGDPDYAAGLELVHQADFGPPGSGATYLLGPSSKADGVESAYTLLVRQNRLSENDGMPSYTAIVVMGLSMEYQINTSDVPEGVGAGGYVDYRYRFVDVEIFPEDPEQDSEFRWPIHLGSLKKVSAMRREKALQEALAATVFLRKVEKVKWYQKTFFKWLIIIIVIIIIIVAQQYHLLSQVSTMASAAFAAGATATAVAFAALYVVMVFALGFLISFAGSLIGGTWGKVFVIVASIYMAGGTDFFSNIGSSWQAMTANLGWGTAAKFLASINPIIDITRLIVEDRAMAKLEAEMKDFTKDAREKYDELEAAYDMLGSGVSGINPLDLVNAFSNSWYVEQPENYYQRTLTTNPGMISYDMVNRFHELALTIPENGNPGDFIPAMFEDMEKQRGAV